MSNILSLHLSAMADVALSSDSEGAGRCPPPLPKQRSKKSKSKSHKSRASTKSSQPNKAEQKRHQALEKQFLLAQQASLMELSHVSEEGEDLTAGCQAGPSSASDTGLRSSNLLRSQGVSRSLPNVYVPPTPEASVPRDRTPTATFTPTAAGLRPDMPCSQPNLQSILSDALAKILVAGIQQESIPSTSSTLPAQASAPAATVASRLSRQGMESSSSSSSDSDGSEEGEICPEDVEFADDEDLPPEKPAFKNLFKPALFKSLLHKAKKATKFRLTEGSTAKGDHPSDPHDSLFQVSTQDDDAIPYPPLFSNVLKSALGQPGSLAAPSGLDKRLYPADVALEETLAIPSVDPPVAALASSSMMTSDVVDGLKTEDRKLEMGYRKAHQAAAWAIKAAMATSFFNRATLIWLRQHQERLPPTDTRLHQDINKMVAATEYSADASLTAAKFASRALAATVTNRRLFWLRNWRADNKAKWKLAAALFTAPSLFGPCLDPILVEDKDKRKVLPSSFRRADRKYTPYHHRQSFRSYSGPSGSYYQRPYHQGSDRTSDRQPFRDRGRSQSQSKRPFRGAGYRPARRGK